MRGPVPFLVRTCAAISLVSLTGFFAVACLLSLFTFNDGDLPGGLIFFPCAFALFAASVFLFWKGRQLARFIDLLALTAYGSLFFTANFRRDLAADAPGAGALFAVVILVAEFSYRRE